MSAFWLQKPSILRACVREEDAGGREAGSTWDLKMPLENGGADERVSRGQASDRSVCVCEEVSVEMGARRPPLPTAVGPPGRHRRLRLAITADCFTPSLSRGGWSGTLLNQCRLHKTKNHTLFKYTY